MNHSVSVPEALQLVDQLVNTGQLRSAAQVCQQILEAAPKHPDARYYLGMIKLQVGAVGEALQLLVMVVEQRPDHAPSVAALAAAYEADNQVEEAIEQYRRALDLDDRSASTHQHLATALLHAGHLGEAAASARRAYSMRPESPEVRHLLAQILQAQGEHDQALAYHREALRDPKVRRCQVIQAVIAAKRATTYLEIGVDTGDNLRFVLAPIKLAVDPIPPARLVEAQVAAGRARYFEMTSDDFFAKHASLFVDQAIDVAFVDGLHTYAQAMQDVSHCLDHLADGGVILMHDCNPTSEAMAIPAASHQEAIELQAPGSSTDWTGDVWKAIVQLRASRGDLRTYVLDCDFGIGVVVKSPGTCPLDLEKRSVPELTYHDLEADRERFLGLRPPSELWEVLDPGGPTAPRE